MKKYAYIRVSTLEQNIDRQINSLHQLDIPSKNIVIDKSSGKDFNRPGYEALLRRLRRGDVLFVSSIDRLGRNYEEIQNQWRKLTKQRKVDIVVLDMPLLDTRIGRDIFGTLVADIVLQLLCFVAEYERDMLKKRQKEGIEAAKAKGVKFGRPIKPLPENFLEIVKEWEIGQISMEQVLNELEMAQSSFFRRLKEVREVENKKTTLKKCTFW